MSNTEQKRCQRQILVSPSPNPTWACLELACALDKFHMELGGWEKAEKSNGSAGFQQCAWKSLPSSGDLPFPLQMPGCIRGGFAWSPPSATILPKQAGIKFGICQLQLCTAKPAFQVVQLNQTRSETGLTPTSHPPWTSHHFASVLRIPERVGNSG